MEVKNWTLGTFIVLAICTWHTESVSRLDWLDSDKKSARPEEVVASSIDDDSEEFDTRFDRFGREIRIPRGKNAGTDKKNNSKQRASTVNSQASKGGDSSQSKTEKVVKTTPQTILTGGSNLGSGDPRSNDETSTPKSTTAESNEQPMIGKINVADLPTMSSSITTTETTDGNPGGGSGVNTTQSSTTINTVVPVDGSENTTPNATEVMESTTSQTIISTTDLPSTSKTVIVVATDPPASSDPPTSTETRNSTTAEMPSTSTAAPESTSSATEASESSTTETSTTQKTSESTSNSSSMHPTPYPPSPVTTTEPFAPTPAPVTILPPGETSGAAEKLKNSLGSFTCENLPKEYKGCSDICEDMRQNGEVTDEEGKMDTLAIIFFALFGVTVVVNLGVFFYFTCKTKRIPTIPPKPPADDAAAKLRAAYQNAPDPRDKVPVKKEDEGIDEPGPPSVKDTAAIIKMRAKLLETQANLQKLRAHVKKTTKQHKSDTRSGKFQKKGPIFIPMEPPIPPAAVLPDGIVLDNVTYNPKDNEMWEIGSDVDDIELDESFRLNTDSITETEDDPSHKSGSKKSKASKKQEGTDAKSKKTITEESKTPNVIETPAPAATPTAPAPAATPTAPAPTATPTAPAPTATPTAPAPTASAAPTAPATPTTPAPEPPKDGGKGADGKDKKDNKAGGNPSNKKN